MPLKKAISILLLIFISVLFTELGAQSINDYRSKNSGNWTTLSVWEFYNGTAWVAATSYPGQNTGTNDVTILGGNSVTLSSNIPNDFNSLTVGDGIGSTDELLVAGNSTLGTMNITISDGGFASWTANVSLYIPAGSAFILIPSGSLDISNPCSAAKRIVIGTVIYSSCNGGAGATYSFSDLNSNGGSLNVAPSSNEPICEGADLELFSNTTGTGSGTATFNWSANGPSGYTYSSTLSNPTISGLIAGTYTFIVQATSGSISNTDSVMVTVIDIPDSPINEGDTTICNGATFPSISANVNLGETVDWYDAISSGNLLLSGSTGYVPSSGGSFFAEARNITTGCTSNSRTEITINVIACIRKVIMNRHITRFIKNN